MSDDESAAIILGCICVALAMIALSLSAGAAILAAASIAAGRIGVEMWRGR